MADRDPGVVPDTRVPVRVVSTAPVRTVAPVELPPTPPVRHPALPAAAVVPRVSPPAPPPVRRVGFPAPPRVRSASVPAPLPVRRVGFPAPPRVRSASAPAPLPVRRLDTRPAAPVARHVGAPVAPLARRVLPVAGALVGQDAGRGTTAIADRVFERIAAVAATQVTGVGPVSGGHASQLLGRGLPRASVDRAGSHVQLAATTPLRWPSPAPAVAAAVRSHVHDEVARMTGQTVDRVDVELADTARSGGTVRPAEPVTPLAARVPTGPAAASVPGVLLALVLVGLGVVAVRDALVASGAVGGAALLPRAGRWLAGLTATGPVLGLSIAALVVGLVLLLLALKRRSRPDLLLDAQTPIHLAPRDAARVAAAVADDVDGVREASATGTRSKVAVRVGVTGETREISDAVTGRVTEALEPVRTRRGGAAPTVTTTMRSI